MIRPMTPRDADAASLIYNHYVRTSTATFQTEPLSAAEWWDDVKPRDPERHGVWAITEDGTAGLAGYVLVTAFKGRCAYRDTAEVTVYLKEGCTGRGLGRAALAHVDAHAAAVGLHALLAVVCAENESSLRAFERAGYERAGHLREVGTKFGRLLDVVYLEKVVGSQP
jgi:phosphinothricin acetyltransferase